MVLCASLHRRLLFFPLVVSHSFTLGRNPLFLRAMSSVTSSNKLVVDPFCIRQFNNPDYTGTHVNYDVMNFENKVNSYFEAGQPLIDGYAPFW